MSKIIDRLILLLVCIGSVFFLEDFKYAIVIVLVGVIYSGVAFYASDSRVHTFIDIAMGAMIMAYDGFIMLLPLLVYECFYGFFKKDMKELVAVTIAILGYIITVISGRECLTVDILIRKPILFGTMMLAVLVGIYLAYNTTEILKLRKEKLKIRDDGEELRQVMIAKNRLMREQQDNNITMATLKERNRIAREIHDNVGHLLSRSLLQVGALRTIYKEEPLAEALMGLQDTLNESMMNVRNSVHDLHNESFDLHRGIKELITKHDRFITDLDYDISDSIPRKIKYCIYSIVTEAFHNAEKYSRGDRVDITVREHPGIYQLVFKDNGENAVVKENGIGLHNMQSRVDELDGTLTITTDNGFKIFISIPKKGV